MKRSNVVWPTALLSLACIQGPAAAEETVRAGHVVVYTMTIRNKGPATAREVVMRDPVDSRLEFRSAVPSSCDYEDGSVTCRFSRLDPREAVTVEWRGRVAPDTPDGYLIRSVARVSAATPESRLDNNRASAEIVVTNRPPAPPVAEPVDEPREELPFTGLLTWPLGLAGLLVGVGLAVRWTARRRRLS
ncbi:DUF11 domain-containing protein [Streptosporangium saharense]|uniref:DUF11 domain-containing protein n=1 Tax=Streptosporangium saharense TaxID=1706840 RepID=UPI0036A48EBB